MASLIRVPVPPLPPERFQSVLGEEAYQAFSALTRQSQDLLAGRVIWNVNSTSRGGGVAEMLRSLIAYARGGGTDARWIVVSGNPDFFRVTKRIHNNLHGSDGDGGDLGEQEGRVYEGVLEQHAEELMWLVRKGDIVILHDPQTAGLTRPLRSWGAWVVWRCHVGLDLPNDLARRAWDFLLPYVSLADAYVFSRRAHAWEGLETEKLVVIPPSIDAFSPKNQELEPRTVDAILGAAGLIDQRPDAPPTFVREDGTPGRVDRHATLADGAPPPPSSARFVSQVSRWDRLKDPLGVIRGFAEHVAPVSDAHLIYAGPAAESVFDDPEGLEVLEDSTNLWRSLPPKVRSRVHLASLPMEDAEENAAVVNALQRRSEVVVQKSLAEGFGLTVAEAAWKARPVVASRIGGIQDQIVHGETGILIDDPRDLAEYGGALTNLLSPEGRIQAANMGEEAQRRVRDNYLGPRHLAQWFDLIRDLIAGGC